MYLALSFISLLLATISMIFAVDNYQLDNKGLAVLDFICSCVCLIAFYCCVACGFVVPCLEMTGSI